MLLGLAGSLVLLRQGIWGAAAPDGHGTERTAGCLHPPELGWVPALLLSCPPAPNLPAAFRRGDTQAGVAPAHQQPADQPGGEAAGRACWTCLCLNASFLSQSSFFTHPACLPPTPAPLSYPPTRQDLDPLSTLPRLRYLSLLDNPVSKQAGYRLYVIARCKKLKMLDFRKVKQKVRCGGVR